MKQAFPFRSSKVDGLASIEVHAFQGGRKMVVKHVVVSDDEVVALATRRGRSVVLVSTGWMRKLSYGDAYYRRSLLGRLVKLGVVTSDQHAAYRKEEEVQKIDDARVRDVTELRRMMVRRGREFNALLKRARLGLS